MNIRSKFFVFASLGFAVFCASAAIAQKTQSKPNIIIIYTDDLGFGDISANGATKISTPNIDRISAQGLRFIFRYT